jgi:hypothetical protein
MSEPEHSEVGGSTSAEPRARPSGTAPWVFRAVPAVTFLVGLLLGGFVVGVGLDRGGSDPGEPGPTATTPEGTGPAPTSAATVVVPSACMDAADEIEAAITLIRDGVGAVRDFQPEELVRVLDELEELEARARDLAARCSAVEVDPSP